VKIDGSEKTRLMVITKHSKFIKAFGIRDTGDGQLRSPHAVVFDSQDHLYVADRSNSRVAIFDKDGTSWSPGSYSAGRAGSPFSP
jgi:hypothetical protein